MPVGVPKFDLPHKPGKVRIQFLRKIVGDPCTKPVFQDFQREGCQVRDLECGEDEVELEQPVNVFILLKELGKVVMKAAEQHYGRAFYVAHTPEQLVELGHVRSLALWKKLLGVRDYQDAILQCGDTFVEIIGKLPPVGGVDHLRGVFCHPGGKHLVCDEMGDEVLSGAGVTEDKAVHAYPGATLCHLEFLVHLVQQTDDVVFCYQAFLAGRACKLFSAKAAVFCFGAVLLTAFLAGHMLIRLFLLFFRLPWPPYGLLSSRPLSPLRLSCLSFPGSFC